jgi:predicted glycosyltransferase
LTEKGWTPQLLRQTVEYLSRKGKVLISAEGELPEDLRLHAYTAPPEHIHHLMGHLALLVGESATMASECAVLGVPAIYAAQTGRGYTDEQEQNYQLVRNMTDLTWTNLKKTIDVMLAISADELHQCRARLLNDKIDVAAFVADLTVNYPESRKTYRKKFPQNSVKR